MNELDYLRQKLADQIAGVPSHEHTDTAGEKWLCTSPYCPRGNDVRNEPQPAPGETQENADRQYRRGNA